MTEAGATSGDEGRESGLGLEDALRALGTTSSTLTVDQRERLDRDGFLPLPGRLTGKQVEFLCNLLDRLARQEGDRAGTEVHQEMGALRLANLVDKDPLFDRCWNDPLQLAAVAHVLAGKPFKLSSLNSRAALPGQGAQSLHVDWHERVQVNRHQVCNSIWMLCDFTPDNGATRVVPGSHRSGRIPGEGGDDPRLPHPDEVLVTGTAGTCVVFNSHLWHGGTTNRTKQPRPAIHGYFTLRANTQQLVQSNHLSASTIARLSPAQRYLLEV